MSIIPSYTYKCDACKATKTVKTDVIPPHGWVRSNRIWREGNSTEVLHVCPNCARMAVDEWLPANTWWKNTDHWELDTTSVLIKDGVDNV